ncbi:hypothetical protein FG167_09350 [Lacinutrix sp. WUR7]|uniref:hypothetical protein n=1 Tax=Lacinutrix sp. WUR7 TaxID=2653681 RepID=UPI00193E78DF|nr:hypothetical protein [Lacinutrix sp. WUR7]QRM89436.1 hypothetical protein FG167_09350 [Lacinutrix sp. WUR7]
MKTTISKSKYFLLALLVAFSFSCSPEDGEDGADGAIGATGTNGEDGNANVETYTYDISALTGTTINISTAQLTQDVLDNDGVFVYIQRNSNYYPIPGTSFNDEIKTILINGAIELTFYDRITGASVSIPANRYTLLKMVIIESNNTTTGRTSATAKQQALNDLNQAGVDPTDYYAVCDYYGIAY